MHARPDDPDALLRRALRAQPIFADLKPVEQSALAGVLRRVATLAPGQTLPATKPPERSDMGHRPWACKAQFRRLCSTLHLET